MPYTFELTLGTLLNGKSYLFETFVCKTHETWKFNNLLKHYKLMPLTKPLYMRTFFLFGEKMKVSLIFVNKTNISIDIVTCLDVQA